MIQFIYYLIAFIVAIGILVAIHEYGHYLAARLCNVKVLRFSLGFGKVIWSRRFGRDQTEWAVSLIPLGGYVKMLDEREGEVAEHERPRAFTQQSLGRQSFIVAAGPLMNLLLAILLYWFGFVWGRYEPLPVLGTPEPNTPAAVAGIVGGERVVSVNQVAVDTWPTLSWQIISAAKNAGSASNSSSTGDGDGDANNSGNSVSSGSSGDVNGDNNESERLTLEVIPDYVDAPTSSQAVQRRELSLSAISADRWQSSPLTILGIHPYSPPIAAVVDVLADGPAAQSGLLSGDQIIAINEQPIDDWSKLINIVRPAGTTPLALTVLRKDTDGQSVQLRKTVTPTIDATRRVPMIGVKLQLPESLPQDNQYLTFVRHDPLSALWLAVQQTGQQSLFTVQMLGKMLIGQVSSKNISGPLTIANIAGKTASYGILPYLEFLAIISLSLGVLNLLPIPVLDGGHLLYYALQFISQKRISDRWFEYAQRFGVTILGALMCLALFNDFNRLILN